MTYSYAEQEPDFSDPEDDELGILNSLCPDDRYRPDDSSDQPSAPDRFWTIPTTVMTLPRMAAGVAIPLLALRGHKTTGLTIAGGISDFESKPADLVDFVAPNAGLGRSNSGADLDYKADGVFGTGCLVAAAFSERSSSLARLAAGIGAVKQGLQLNWAVRADLEHRRQTGEKLTAKVDMTGKLATAALIGSNALSTVVRDMPAETGQQRQWRRLAGAGAVGLAAVSLVLGEKARRKHDRNFRAKMNALQSVAA